MLDVQIEELRAREAELVEYEVRAERAKGAPLGTSSRRTFSSDERGTARCVTPTTSTVSRQRSVRPPQRSSKAATTSRWTLDQRHRRYRRCDGRSELHVGVAEDVA